MGGMLVSTKEAAAAAEVGEVLQTLAVGIPPDSCSNLSRILAINSAEQKRNFHSHNKVSRQYRLLVLAQSLPRGIPAQK